MAGLALTKALEETRAKVVKLKAERDALVAGLETAAKLGLRATGRVDDLQAEVARLTAERDAMRGALESLVRHCSNQARGGAMAGMADQQQRLKWYEGLHPILEDARAALSPTPPQE